MGYRLGVDPDVCISSGTCVAEAPQLFRFDDDEIAETIPGAPPPADDVALRVARSCPSGAIRLFDGDEEIDVF